MRRLGVTFLLLAAGGLSSCGDPRAKYIDASTGELRWFQCVLREGRTSNVANLERSERDACYGVEVRVPAGFHTEQSRKWSRHGYNPYGGLQIDVPRRLISDEQVPHMPPAYEYIRVVLRPMHAGTPFFRGEYVFSMQGQSPRPSRTGVYMTGLQGFWHVQDTETEENGFRIFETPRAEQRPNHGKRVYAPTNAHPDLFAACNLSVIDNRDRKWAPTCVVHTNYEPLFEMEYRILHADIQQVRSFDREFKHLLGEWIARR